MAGVSGDIRVVFCFPYHGVGGVSLLFLRVAEFLATVPGAKISVVDYLDGFMAKNLKHGGVSLIEYSDDKDVELPEQAVVVFQSMTPWSIFPRLRFQPKTKLLFWNCFPYNLVPRIPGLGDFAQVRPGLHKLLLNTLFRPFKNTCRRFTRVLLQHNGLVFMDSPNLETTEWGLGLQITRPEFLPVCMPRAETSQIAPAELPLRAAWIGRIADFKAPILNYTLRRLSEQSRATATPIEFTIIGDGDYAIHDVSHEHFQVRHIPFLSPESVPTFLAEKCDVLFAMGTSALEGARVGVPTVLLDICYGAVPEEYKFRFLTGAKNFSLGDLASASLKDANRLSIQEVISKVLASKPELGAAMRSYFLANHTVDAVGQKLIDHVRRTQLTYCILKDQGLLERPVAYRVLYALRNLSRSSLRLSRKT